MSIIISVVGVLFTQAYLMISLNTPRDKFLNLLFSFVKYSFNRQFLFLHIYSRFV